MKIKLILLILCAFLLSGCSNTYFQLYNTEQYINDQPLDAITISYDFWAPNGRMAFNIKNNTDKIITIHTEKCFFVLNGISNCYYNGQTLTTGTNINISRAIVNPWDSKSVITSGSAGYTASSIIQQEKTTRIAPRAIHPFNSYIINKNIFFNENLKSRPTKKDKTLIDFTKENSPIKFSNVITFSIEGDEKQYLIEHGFYVKNISNYVEKVFMKSNLKWPENLNKSYYSDYANGLSFYIVY